MNHPKSSRLVCAVALLATGGLQLAIAESPKPAAAPNGKPLDEPVRAFLARHCQECHGTKKPKGNFPLGQLSADFTAKSNRDDWQKALDQLKSGDMPPKGKPRPPEKEVKAVTEWIGGSIAAADATRRSMQGRVVCRRLNRVEYENTVRNLLGVEADLKELLALDSSMDGFDNVGSALHISSFAMERYLEAADKALGLAIANRPQAPPRIKKRYSLKETHQVKHGGESVFRLLGDDAVVCFTSVPWQAVGLSPFYPPDRGNYRFRISASAFQSNGKPVPLRVLSGGGMGGKPAHLVGYFDAPADKPAVIEFIDYMEARTTISILPYGLARSNIVHKIGADKYPGVGMAVQWVEVEGPLYDAWPPSSHRRVLGDLPWGPPMRTNYGPRVEVVSKDPATDADRILRTFVRRAFRRAVTDDDIKPFAALFQAKMTEKRTFEQAIRAALMAVMVSPDFLFLREKPGKLDDFALASRLSYFLWSTMPDDELLALAEEKKLSHPETLRGQVERLLKGPKANAFTVNFVGQWLGLRDIDFTEPSYLYPEYDQMLRASMVRETELFFTEILANDLSLTNFVASDFSMLNGRLAKHYGIPGVDGWAFRKVALPKESHRGGVMTMASVLKTTANGTNTSPVVRGAWVLERILGTPPPKPPPDVPAVTPDIRGATTIREQLAKHRQVASCATCHSRIDPPGFALESFDVIGGWRENYRTTGRGQTVMIDGRRMPYLKGPKVDPADAMADGRRFANIDGFKQLLLKDKDQLARALAEKLVTYATGGAPEAADKAEIETIIGKVRAKDYGFRTLVHEIAQSRMFQNK